LQLNEKWFLWFAEISISLSVFYIPYFLERLISTCLY